MAEGINLCPVNDKFYYTLVFPSPPASPGEEYTASVGEESKRAKHLDEAIR